VSRTSSFSFFCGVIIANYFAASDVSFIREVCQFYEEICIGSGNVSNSLEEASVFVSIMAVDEEPS
jgi:hypothetical protein